MTVVDGRPPTGRWVRTTTRRIQDARAGRGGGSLLLEIWSAALVLAVQGAVLGSAVVLLGEGVVPGLGERTVPGGDLGGALVGVVLVGGLLGLAARLGPVGLGRSGATWWLPLPVDRRGLLRPAVLGWPAATGLAAGFVTPLAVIALGGRPDLHTVAGWAALAAAGGAVVVSLAMLLQTAAVGRADRAGRVLATVGDTLMVGGSFGLVLVLTSGATWRLGAWDVVAGALLVVVVVLVAATDRRAGRIDGALLRARSGVGDRARGAVLSLDLRELSRALSGAPRRLRRRSWALRPGGPGRALVLGDVVLVTRTPRVLVQVVVAGVLGVAAGAVLAPGVLLYLAWVLTAFWAAGSLAAGGRHGDAVPAVERLLPLSRRVSRAAHGVVPLVGTTLWSVVVLGTEAWRAAEPAWLALAPSWALVMAAAAVRAAYRPPSRYLAAQVSTPMGGIPSTGGLLQGIDVAVAGTLPTAFVLLSGGLGAAGGVNIGFVTAVQGLVAIATATWVVWYVGKRDREV